MKRTQGGFTLVEMLVVMSLLAVIMVATVSSLRTMAQTETRVDERLQRVAQMRVVSSFLRKTLGRIDGSRVINPNQPGESTPLFFADDASITWVGVMPARHGTGGRHFFKLALDGKDADKALVLRYLPWTPLNQFPDWSQSDSHVLVKGMKDFHVEAKGLPADLQLVSPDWPIGWVAGWAAKGALPQQLRLSLEDEKHLWPPLVIAVSQTPQSRPNSGGFTIGGAAR